MLSSYLKSGFPYTTRQNWTLTKIQGYNIEQAFNTQNNMKHIFYIHSNICAIIAKSIIDLLLNENKSKIVIILARKTQWMYNKKNITFIDGDIFSDNIQLGFKKINSINKYIEYKKFIKEKRSKIYDIFKESFYLYTPTSRNLFSFIGFTNINCKGYFFIEEGTLSYRKKQTTILEIIKYTISQILGIKRFYFFYTNNKFKGVYAINSHAFPWCNNKKKVIVNLPKEKANYIKPMKYILTFGYLTLDAQTYIKACEKIIDFLYKQKETYIGFKFHPYTYTNNNELIEILSLFLLNNKRNIEFIDLHHTIIEEYIYYYHSEIICIDNLISSLVLYSTIFNGKSYFYNPEDQKFCEYDNIDDVLKTMHL